MPLIDSLIEEGWLKTPEIVFAFRKIKRIDFLPEASKNLSELNEALPIGLGQTISQPLVVAFMLELLQPKKGEKILDVGSGSGWTTALLAEIVGEEGLPAGRQGRVTAIEVVPELKELGEANVENYGFLKNGTAKIICTDGSKGYEKEAPFDKILASASAARIPGSWKKQLKVGGRIVAPIGNSIWLLIKKNEKDFEEYEYPGFCFVPLITKE